MSSLSLSNGPGVSLSVWLALVSPSLLAGCGERKPPQVASAPRPPTWSYEIRLAKHGILEAEAHFSEGAIDDGTELSVTEGAEPFVSDVRASTGSVELRGTSWFVRGCATGCTLRYTFALREAARTLRDDEVANRAGAALQAPPGTWLLRPLAARSGDRFRVAVSVPRDQAFVTGLTADRDADAKGAPRLFSGAAISLGRGPFSVFGPLETTSMEIASAPLTLAITGGARTAPRAELARWVERSGRIVAQAFGRFPAASALVAVLPGPAGRVGYGRVTASPLGGSILVDVGSDVTAAELASDWVLVHEMIHLGFPSLERRHRWMEEGLATYLEPILRARGGLVPADELWNNFARMMPNGTPQKGDRGLDGTPTWGRIYWGGALFCFVADLEIRKATTNKKSLDDALRGILAAGGHNGVRWDIGDAFRVGDAATGTTVLSELYRGWKDAPATVDLERLFGELGVSLDGDSVRFDDSAPLAAMRKSMTAPR